MHNESPESHSDTQDQSPIGRIDDAEARLANSDPAEAPAVAERIADELGDLLETTATDDGGDSL